MFTPLLILFICLFQGIGAGLLIIPTFVVVQEYFTTKRAAAAAIASCGISMGGLLFGPILRLLIDAMGWRGALLIFAAINFQLMIFPALLRPLASHGLQSTTTKSATEVDQSGDTKRSQSRCCEACSKILKGLSSAFNISLLKELDCVLFLVLRWASIVGVNAMYMFGITRAIYLGVEPLTASLITTCIGVMSTVGRIAMAIWASRVKFNHTLMAVVPIVLAGVVVTLSTVAKGVAWHHLLFAAAFGIFGGKKKISRIK